MKILVCGDRNWEDRDLVLDVLNEFCPEVVIEGHARGVDQIAHKWAESHAATLFCFPAEWGRYGRSAGPIRNRRMAELMPDLVLAFHDSILTSKGTGDMLTIAEDQGIPYALLEHSGRPRAAVDRGIRQ